MKEFIKRLVKALPIAFTKNQRYDRQTRRIIKMVCHSETNTVDVGCHKGEILDLFLKAAPKGVHYGFEPVPHLYAGLQKKYAGRSNCRIMDIALSDREGSADFNHVVSNPSYSGFRKRRYDRPEEKDEIITVRTARLDDILPPDFRVDLIKIDVEGGELLVLEGARQTLERCKPTVIFEHGIGASDLYGAGPEKIFELLEDCGLKVSLLSRFIQNGPPLEKEAFYRQYYERKNYYFIAY